MAYSSLEAHPGEEVSGVSSSDITTTSSTQVIAAAAGKRSYVTQVTVSNLHASVSTRVDILSGSSLKWQVPAAFGGGGAVIVFDPPLECGVNEAVNAQCATTGAAVRVAVNGFQKDG